MIKIFIPGGLLSYVDIVIISIVNEFKFSAYVRLQGGVYSLYGELKPAELNSKN
jgi:hypothetical protein